MAAHVEVFDVLPHGFQRPGADRTWPRSLPRNRLDLDGTRRLRQTF